MRDLLSSIVPGVLSSWQPASGGSICMSFICELADASSCFVKLLYAEEGDILKDEELGLKELEKHIPPPLRVPAVISCGSEGIYQYLVLEYIEPGPDRDYELFGSALADMHRIRVQRGFGLDHDNHIGRTLQRNGDFVSWIEFYRTKRLLPLAEAVRQELPLELNRQLMGIIGALEQLLREPEHPSLLHGDLWGQNHLFDRSGRPVLIDPAVYYGDREADLAMTLLFGAFPEEFYHAYQERCPLNEGYEKRMVVYQLYHALNHMALFGEGYLPMVEGLLYSISV